MADTNVVQKDLGPVSAYAIAVKHGYKGTEEEWAALQIASAENAKAADASAKEAAETLAAVHETVEQETNAAVAAVNNQETASIQSVQDAAQTAAAQQEEAIAAKGQEVLATIPEDYTKLGQDVAALTEEIADNGEKIGRIDNVVFQRSINIYNPALQTAETISPHYWKDGSPWYEQEGGSTSYDASINATAPIPMDSGKTYTAGCVPPVLGTVVLPWVVNESLDTGIMFFDKNDTYLGKSEEATFTTPAGTKYARYNYSKGAGVNLTRMNPCMMIVEGDTLPDVYTPYYCKGIDEKVMELEEYHKPINAVIKNGDTYTVLSKAFGDTYVARSFGRIGANGLFELKGLGYGRYDNENYTEEYTVFNNYISDFIGPLSIGRWNETDGYEGGQWSGGNHSVTVDGVTYRTAKESSFSAYCDGEDITNAADGVYHGRATFVCVNDLYYPQTITDNAFTDATKAIEERRTYSIDGEDMCVDVHLLFLDKVGVISYYGMQYPYSINAFSSIYIEGMEKTYAKSDIVSPTYFDKPSSVYVINAGDGWTHEMILNQCGIANREKLKLERYGYGNFSNGKIYQQLIERWHSEVGQELAWSGVYRIKHV